MAMVQVGRKETSADSKAEDGVKKKSKKEKSADFESEDGVKKKSKKETSADSKAEVGVKKKSKKEKNAASESEDGVKKKSKKEKSADSESEDGVKKKSKKEKSADSDSEHGVKKISKKETRADSESEDGLKKKSKKETRADSKAEDGVKNKSKKGINADSEAEDGGKKKMKSKKESGDEKEEPIDDAKKRTGKRKREEIDLRDQENTDNDIKRTSKKKKKKKLSVESEVEETSFNSTKNAKNEKTKQCVDSEVEDNNLNSTKDAKKKSNEKKPSEDSEAEEIELNSTKDAKKKRKKKKQSGVSEAEENNNEGEEAKKKRKEKKKKKQSEVFSEAEGNNNEGEDAKKKSKMQESVTTPSSKSSKKVKFSDQVEFFPAEVEEREDKDKEEDEHAHEGEGDGLVRGKRFTKEEDELIKKAVWEYIDNHALGEEGLNMVMDCQNHKELKGCWKEIESALPWRARYSVYNRAHAIFQSGSKGIWTTEDLELVKQFQEKHGNDWKTLAEAMGKHRIHVKDAWRRIRLNKDKGHWSREEYQSLFDLVNKDIRMKAYQEKHSKHGMLRDNIPWTTISDVHGTRDHAACCTKWYEQLLSPMIKQGIWANVDDYRLVEELLKLDAACMDDVDWDNLLDNRDGEACLKRWNQMVRHIGLPKSKTFAEQVEILSERYCPDLAEDRENFDNRPYDPED